MGKTKTAFISEVPEAKKSSEEAYREKKERQAREAASAKSSGETKKVHIAGLKGGQRIKIVETETAPAEEEKTVETKEPEGEKKKTTKVPKVRGKKYTESKAKVNPTQSYSTVEAIKLVKETSYSKFDGSVELHLILKKVGTSIQVKLPHSFGREKRIEIANDETVKKLEKGKIDFDILLATVEMMPKLVPFAKMLGPKGLMPNPKNGTLIKSEKDAAKFSVNTLNLKTEKEAPLVHTTIGKVSSENKKLLENLGAIFAGFGGGNKQIVRAYIKATMGPSIKIQVS